MHEDLWQIFRENRKLLRALPAIASKVLMDWADHEYGARVMILAVTHTFGRKLNFNTHVHLIVSAKGLQRSGHGQVCDLDWEDENVTAALLQAWSEGLVDFLLEALDGGLITSQKSHSELTRLLKDHRDRGFYGGVRKVRSRSALLKYYCRYLLRLAIAEYKIISYDGETVEFWYVDTKTRKRTEKTYTVKEFIELLIEHLPDRYRHGIHYSGLLAPRSKPACEVFLSCLGKKLRPRPRRIPWRKLIYITYKRDPLRASNGEIFEKTGWWFPGMPEDRAH
jgi:hypothetical protein